MIGIVDDNRFGFIDMVMERFSLMSVKVWDFFYECGIQ